VRTDRIVHNPDGTVSIPLEDFDETYVGTDTLAGYGDTVKPGDVVDVLFYDPQKGYTEDNPFVDVEGTTILGIEGVSVAVEGGWEPYAQKVHPKSSFAVGNVGGSWWRTFRLHVPREITINEEQEQE